MVWREGLDAAVCREGIAPMKFSYAGHVLHAKIQAFCRSRWQRRRAYHDAVIAHGSPREGIARCLSRHI
jgi:hypothetical protein